MEDHPQKQDPCRISGLLTFIPDVHLLSAGGISLCPVGWWSLDREPIPLYLLPPPSALRCNPFLRSNLSLYCCRSRTSSPSIPPDIRRRDPDLEEHCSARGPPPRSGPRLRCGRSAPSAARRPGPRPFEPLCGTGGLSGETGLAQLGGLEWTWRRPGLRPPTQAPPPPALSAALTFAFGSRGHRDGDALLRGPKAPAAGGRGRGRRRGGGGGGAGGGAGAWKAGQGGGPTGWGALKVAALFSRPPPYTIETV